MHFAISLVLWQERQRLENSLNSGQHLLEHSVHTQMDVWSFCTSYEAKGGSTRGNVGTPQQWRAGYWICRVSTRRKM